MFAGAFTKGKAAAIQTFGTDAQKVLVSLLFEDRVQIISTFDMNRVASLTYCDDTEDEIFDVFRETLARPTDYTVLTLQKTLITLRHVVIYGAEACVNDAWAMARAVEELRRYNTVLIAQSDPNSALGFWHKIKGGGVDQGHPVREAAEKLYELLESREKVRRVRTMSEDPGSIVPVGSKRDAAYMSDEARFRYLQRRMQIEQGQVRKSNLAKSDSSFGAGYTAAGGKGSVVGAAHGIEEMIKAAEREQKRFVDAPSSRDANAYVPKLEDFADALPAKQEEEVPDLLGVQAAEEKAKQEPFKQRDLLDDIPADNLTSGSGTVDLLGVHDAPPTAVDLLGAGDDLLAASNGGGSGSDAGADLLSMAAPTPFDAVSAGGSSAAAAIDPFAPAQSAGQASSGDIGSANPLLDVPAPASSAPEEPAATSSDEKKKKSIMGGSTSQEAISALDELAAMSLHGSGSGDGPPPLPSTMPPPPPGDLPDEPTEMPPPIPDEPPPPVPPEDMPPPPPAPPTDIPELPPPEDMPPAPPPVLDIKDDNLAAEFGGAMGGEAPAPFAPPPPPPPPEIQEQAPMPMGGMGEMGPNTMMGGAQPMAPEVAPSMGMPMSGGGMDMAAMMQAVQSGTLSQEEQAKLMQQMMMQNQMMMQMMMQQQQGGGGGPPM